MQIVSSTTASGITTRTANVPGRCYGSVSFAVGSRDEPVAMRGITHIVLHLIEAALEPRLIPVRTRLGEDSITFSASGTTAQVLRYFDALGDAVLALGKPTPFELGRAKRKLEIEEGGDCSWPGVGPLSYRYGLDEIGRAHFGMPAMANIGKKDVARWASTWFTAENAAVSLTKPLTASFDLELPAGPKPFRGTPASRLEGPLMVASENGGVTLSLVVPSQDADQIGEILHLALQSRLAEEAGLAYSVDYDLVAVSAEESSISFLAAPELPDVAEAARVLVHAIRDIADGGTTAAVLTLALEYEKLLASSDPESVDVHLREANEAALRGFPTPSREESVAMAAAHSAETVAAAVTAALPTLLVLVDDDVDVVAVAKSLKLPIDPFDLVQASTEKAWSKAAKTPKGAKNAPTVWQGKKKDETAGVDAIVGPDALLFREDDVVGAIAYADLVLAGERPDGTLVLVDGDGRWDSFRADEWKRGQAFIAALKKAVPAGLVVAFPAV